MLHILQRDGRISNAALAEQLHLSPSPCLRRLRAPALQHAPQPPERERRPLQLRAAGDQDGRALAALRARTAHRGRRWTLQDDRGGPVESQSRALRSALTARYTYSR